ncbi:MAG: hypothetical protein WC654_07810 [Patescibacteria group bacterium]
MKTWGWIGVAVVVVVGLVVLSVVSRACGTASDMADKTVFNAAKNVWTYEQFHKQFEQYEQYTKQETDATVALKALEEKGVTSGQNYDNLVNELSGVRQMKRRIAADYNAMSQIAYQAFWKSRGLPESLE